MADPIPTRPPEAQPFTQTAQRRQPAPPESPPTQGPENRATDDAAGAERAAEATAVRQTPPPPPTPPEPRQGVPGDRGVEIDLFA